MELYVCIEVAFRGVPMKSSVQLGLGDGPVKSGSNVPTPLYHLYCITHIYAVSESTLLLVAKGVLHLHV